ncbi:MAG: PHP domain-containing protein [Promethearchaeota archaeon]
MPPSKGDPPRFDLHVHSRWSDGVSSVESIVRAADRLDLEVLAVTDHYPAMNVPFDWLPPGGLEHAHVVEFYASELESRKAWALDHGTRLLVGVEFNINAEFDLPVDRLDLLLVEGLWGNPSRFFEDAVPIARRVRKERGRDFPVVLAHPHFESSPFDLREPEGVGAWLDVVDENDFIVELNTSYANYEREAGTFELLVQTTGVKFSVGSDSHGTASLGNVRGAWDFLRRYDAEDRFFLARDFGL